MIQTRKFEDFRILELPVVEIAVKKNEDEEQQVDGIDLK